MTKSVWDRLAEMPEEKRETYLKTGKAPDIRVKTGKKSFGGVVYSRRDYDVPKDAVFSPMIDLGADD